MSKRAASANEEEPSTKRAKLATDQESPLADPVAWDIFEEFLTSSTTSYGDTLGKINDYLGDRFSADEWREATDALFSGDEDDAISLANFRIVRARHLPVRPVTLQTSRIQTSRRPADRFLDLEAGLDDEEDEEDELEEDIESTSHGQAVTQLPAAKHTLQSTVDLLQQRFEAGASSSSRVRRSPPPPLQMQPRMYLLHIYKSVTCYVAEELENQGIPVTVSPWSSGQIYVISDSPKTILASLSFAHQSCVHKWTRISEEEQAAVESSQSKIASPSWIRIKVGKYKDAVAYVFDERQVDNFVVALIAPRDFPYPQPKGTVGLVDPSRLPSDDSVTDIIREGKSVGLIFKGEEYYGGLLKKSFRRSAVEEVSIPHPDDIRFHHQSGWDAAFVKKTENAFSKQFLRVGDSVRVISGAVNSEIGTILSMDYAYGGSARVELNVDGIRGVTEHRLEDLERIFWVGDQISVVAGVHLGLQGYVVEKTGDLFSICQHLTQEQFQVSKFYLDRRPLDVTLQAHLPSQSYVEPTPEADTIEIGDYIEVQLGDYKGKCGFVSWLPSGSSMLWFHDYTVDSGPQFIQVPVSIVQRARIAPTIKFTKDRGYDVRPGDCINVARGPEFSTQGIVESVNFLKAELTFRSDADLSAITVPIRFVMKVRNAVSETFNSYVGKEVYVIGGEMKGYRATLYDVRNDSCKVAVHGQRPITLNPCDVATRYGMRLNGALLEYHDMIAFCQMRTRSFVTPKPRSVTPPPERIPPSRADTSSHWTSWSDAQDNGTPLDVQNAAQGRATPDPWAVDPNDFEDVVEAAAKKLSEKPGPTSWLQEFSSTFFTYHALFKVSPVFLGGKLDKRLAYTQCPDPFNGPDGPAPKGSIAAWCTAKTAGSAVQNYNIPGDNLIPAAPRKKGQECFILDGQYRGCILFVSKCNVKDGTVDLKLMQDSNITINLRNDQVCLVEPIRL